VSWYASVSVYPLCTSSSCRRPNLRAKWGSMDCMLRDEGHAQHNVNYLRKLPPPV
jgi:hypothetical protein